MSVDLSNMFKYPYSKLLGNLPCGKNPTSQQWLNVGAPTNKPPPLRNENCGTAQGCTPRLRFYDGDSDLAMSRKILKESNTRGFGPFLSTSANISPLNMNSKFSQQQQVIGTPLTPFRLLMNAGDPLGSNNAYVAGLARFAGDVRPFYTNPINQVSSTRRASNAAAVRMSGAVPLGNGSGDDLGPANNKLSLWCGNNKWVYDGADYVRFKKLQAKNRNFNDVSWGGDRHSASQTALSRVRR